MRNPREGAPAGTNAAEGANIFGLEPPRLYPSIPMSETPEPAPRGTLSRLALAACALLLFFGGLGAYPPARAGRGALRGDPARDARRGTSLVTPRLNGVLYLEKPPLYYWLNAAALSVLERPETACRLASAFFGLAGLGLAWLLGLSIGGSTGSGRRVALWAAVVLGSSPMWVALSRANIIDMTLTFFLSATLTCFWLAQERAQERTNRERGERLLWMGCSSPPRSPRSPRG